MTNLAESATRYVNGSQANWAELVDIALALTPKQYAKAAERLAKLSNTGKATIKRKLEAILYAKIQEFTAEAIKARGQEAVIGAYVKGKVKARTLPLVAFPHRLTPPVRDGFEETCQRIGKVLKLKTWDEVVEFICADYITTTDEELLHRAGEANAPPES